MVEAADLKPSDPPPAMVRATPPRLQAAEPALATPRRFPWGLVPLALILAVLIGWLTVGRKKPAPAPPPSAVAVVTAKVAVRAVPVAISALGTAQAWQGVLIRAQVNGRLQSVAVREGAQVRAGDVIAEIDPIPYKALLTQTQGTLRRDQALLAGARLDLSRYQVLASQDSIARQQLDTQDALVKQDEGVVLTDEGAVAAAQANLGYTHITAPLAGRVGVRLVDPGNLVSVTDSTGIITINQVSPIAVVFTVPQGDFQRLSDISDGFRRPLATEALSQETGAPLGSGELSIADNHVDSSTGTVAMKARFPNQPAHLWPGQFVNVRLTLQTLSHAIVVPSAAVNQGPRGPFAYVVGADDKVSVRLVSVLTTQDAVTVIASGLTPGETVVTDGQLALKPGATVHARSADAGSQSR